MMEIAVFVIVLMVSRAWTSWVPDPPLTYVDNSLDAHLGGGNVQQMTENVEYEQPSQQEAWNIPKQSESIMSGYSGGGEGTVYGETMTDGVDSGAGFGYASEDNPRVGGDDGKGGYGCHHGSVEKDPEYYNAFQMCVYGEFVTMRCAPGTRYCGVPICGTCKGKHSEGQTMMVESEDDGKDIEDMMMSYMYGKEANRNMMSEGKQQMTGYGSDGGSDDGKRGSSDDGEDEMGYGSSSLSFNGKGVDPVIMMMAMSQAIKSGKFSYAQTEKMKEMLGDMMTILMVMEYVPAGHGTGYGDNAIRNIMMKMMTGYGDGSMSKASAGVEESATKYYEKTEEVEMPNKGYGSGKTLNSNGKSNKFAKAAMETGGYGDSEHKDMKQMISRIMANIYVTTNDRSMKEMIRKVIFQGYADLQYEDMRDMMTKMMSARYDADVGDYSSTMETGAGYGGTNAEPAKGSILNLISSGYGYNDGGVKARMSGGYGGRSSERMKAMMMRMMTRGYGSSEGGRRNGMMKTMTAGGYGRDRDEEMKEKMKARMAREYGGYFRAAKGSGSTGNNARKMTDMLKKIMRRGYGSSTDRKTKTMTQGHGQSSDRDIKELMKIMTRSYGGGNEKVMKKMMRTMMTGGYGGTNKGNVKRAMKRMLLDGGYDNQQESFNNYMKPMMAAGYGGMNRNMLMDMMMKVMGYSSSANSISKAND